MCFRWIIWSCSISSEVIIFNIHVLFITVIGLLNVKLINLLILFNRQRQNYVKYYLPWAIETGTKSKFLMNVYFEERWDQPMSELLKELNITPLALPKKKSTS